ncbi:guanylate kinase [Gracilimonas tropica]|uniref:guanylate kinase n=1 Tax=Gracilimonas tropica TaxID=454600 RepID=UPI0003639BC8|nr:guanylate kinase [Gracilimonas tropica]
MDKKGKVIILVAPSGGGKSTLARRLFKDFDNIKFSVSATTRPQRDYEVDEKHYYFISDEDFDQKVAAGEFLEWEEFYGGKKYGTLRSEVDKKLNSGYFVLLDIEVKGAVNIKNIYGDECLSLFIKPPSIEVLKQRLVDRGTENDETLNLRLARAEKELDYADRFDQVIINDDLDAAYEEVKKAVVKFMNQN